MVKKIIKICLLLIFFSFGCAWIYQSFFIFSVFPGQEAIIIQSGEIVGDPKKSGTHKKIPFFQKIHYVEVDRLRESIKKFWNKKSYLLRVYWSVDDARNFFTASEKHDIKEILNNKLTLTQDYINKNLKTEVLDEISIMKKRNCEYNNQNLIDITNFIQEDLISYGIKIVRVDILNE